MAGGGRVIPVSIEQAKSLQCIFKVTYLAYSPAVTDPSKVIVITFAAFSLCSYVFSPL